MNKVMTTVMILLACTFQTAFAARIPQSVSTDARIREVTYDPSEVYEIKGNYRFTTTIEFEKGETVQYLTLGDTLAWQAHPMGNRVHLKPVEPHAITNLTVVTDKRTYYFRLTARDTQGKYDATYLLRFNYGTDDGIAVNPNALRRPMMTGQFSDSASHARNCHYSVSGSHTIGLVEACDDGVFTYLEFNKHANLPAIYAVDAQGNEALINYRMEGNYVVVERVASLYTLREGNDSLCLFNEDRPYRTKTDRARTPLNEGNAS
jgi:type IV secretion system protein VirB9